MKRTFESSISTVRIKIRTIIIVGVVLREIFSFWTGHPFDFELWVRTGYWVVRGVSPYGVLPAAPALSFASAYSKQATSTIGYLPFWPLVTGALYEIYTTIGIQNRFLFYFLLKQPMIIGDVMLAFALYSYVKMRNLDRASWILKFWLLSPLNIILSGIWGMFDSLSMLFVVLALNSKNQTGRPVGSGLATFIKSIPIIYSIPLSLSGTRRLRGMMIAVGIPAFLSLAVLLLNGWYLPEAYRVLSSTVTKGGESLSAADILFYLNSAGLVTDAQLGVMKPLAYAWIAGVLVATFAAFKKFGFRDDRSLVQSLLLCTLAFMIIRLQVNEQYTIYLFALAAIDVSIWNPSRRKILLSSLGVVVCYLVVNSPLLLRFASPVFPSVLHTEQVLINIYNQPRFALKAILAVAFTTLNGWYLVLILRQKSA